MTIRPSGDFNSALPWPAGAVEDWQHGAGYTFIAEKYGRSYGTVSKMLRLQKELGTERVTEATRRRGGPARFSDQTPISPVHTAVGIKVTLHRLRQDKMNYEDLGRVTHTNRRVARKMELGIHDFTVSQLQSIADMLNTTVEELMKPQGNKK